MSSGKVITDIGGACACAWCGLLIPLATFEAHSAQCQRASMNGQRSLFGGARGLFDELEAAKAVQA